MPGYSLEVTEDKEAYMVYTTVPKGSPEVSSLLKLCNELRLRTCMPIEGALVLSKLRLDWLEQERQVIKEAYEVDPYLEARNKRRPHAEYDGIEESN